MNNLDSTVEHYKQNLENAFSSLVSQYNKLQLSDHTENSINEGTKLISNGSSLVSMLKRHIQSLETLLCDCEDFVDEVYDDLSHPQPEEDFVYSSAYGMLSYKGREHIERKKEKPSPSINNPSNTTEEYKRTLLPEVDYYFKAQHTNKLSTINPMFQYYNNPLDVVNAPGLYCCIVPGVYIRVPFPEIIDSTKEYSRVRSIRCKYRDKEMCDEQRLKMAKYHNSSLRICNFAHKGEQLVKIGYLSRCSSIPRFGDPSTLIRDIKNINLDEIKNVLMYGLNDIITSAIWLDYNKVSNVTYPNIDIV